MIWATRGMGVSCHTAKIRVFMYFSHLSFICILETPFMTTSFNVRRPTSVSSSTTLICLTSCSYMSRAVSLISDSGEVTATFRSMIRANWSSSGCCIKSSSETNPTIFLVPSFRTGIPERLCFRISSRAVFRFPGTVIVTTSVVIISFTNIYPHPLSWEFNGRFFFCRFKLR